MLIDLGQAPSARAELKLSGKSLAEGEIKGPGIARLRFPLKSIPLGASRILCTVSPPSGSPWNALPVLERLAPKPNEVKVDRLTGAFSCDGLPLFPFGFYCYSPVQPTLPEEEFVRGFSMISPYQDIAATKIEDRKKYMDRCASLGMKVNYSLVSLSGGGSGAHLTKDDLHRRDLLVDEVKAFRDHPALLAWYLSDEPDGQGVSPEALMEQYRIVHDLDPYHPILMVFCVPSKAPEYKDALDVAMADPYPIPNSSPVEAGDTIAGLRKAFGWEKPLWVVPQAFGGNEWWAREPTPQEVRLMTWQSILNGATGVQYFVRHGLGGFPKSPSMWAECGRMAEEVFELEPFLNSTDKAPAVSTDVSTVQVRSWRHGSQLLVGVVNKRNAPEAVRITVQTDSAEARLPFENRNIKVDHGVISDFIDGYGTRFYVLEEGAKWRKDPTNPMVDASFEENPTAGVPSACYLNVGSDRGATARVDPRTSHSGAHSVRLTAPIDGGGMALSFYPIGLQPGKTYRATIWARAMPGTSPKFELSVDPASATKTFTLSPNWKQYDVSFKLPTGPAQVRTTVGVRLATKGIAWIDDVGIFRE
ncbi:MAG: beta-galactosidase [Fimbriimonas sp.]|nr:beta-galactosidase [Fimbriimonas sp.]